MTKIASAFHLPVLRFLLLFFATFSLGKIVAAPPVYQDQAPKEVQEAVQLSAWLESNQTRSDLAGKTTGYIDFSFQLETQGAFKAYKEKLKLYPAADPLLGLSNWKLEIIKSPPEIFFMDPISKESKTGYRGQAVFVVRAKLPEEGLQNPLPLHHKIPLLLDFQVCSENLCLLPTTLRFDFEITNAAKVAAQSEVATLTGSATKMLRDNLGIGTWSLSTFLILFLAGLITAFTPCVYPLYPITLGIFSRWSHAHKTASPFFMAVAYCLGMVLSYAILGLLSIASGAVFGSLTQTPAFLIGTGVLIIISALVFEGIIDLPIFRWLQEKFSAPISSEKKLSNFQLYAKAFGMGSVLGLVASPCVGPVLIVILAWLSQKLAVITAANLFLGFVLLATFGFGMSLPFLLLGHLMFKLGTRPKLGILTPYFKHLGTALMLGASLLFLVPGIKMLRLNRTQAVKRYPVESLDSWKKNKPTVLDFRADWCAACLELETETFSQSEVSKLFEDGTYTFVRIDLTEMNETQKAIADRFKVVGLPTILISNAKGEICESESLFGFENANDFLARLKRAQAACP